MELQLVQSLAINRSDYITNLYLSFVIEIFLNMRRKNKNFTVILMYLLFVLVTWGLYV
jgi:hypothetical protein